MPDTILSSVLVIAFLLSIGLFLWAIFNHIYVTHLCFMRLRKFHLAEYEKLGAPHVLLNNSISATLDFWEFVRSGRYRQLGDSELERLVRRRRILTRLALVAVISWVACWAAMSSLSPPGAT